MVLLALMKYDNFQSLSVVVTVGGASVSALLEDTLTSEEDVNIKPINTCEIVRKQNKENRHNDNDGNQRDPIFKTAMYKPNTELPYTTRQRH